MENKYDMGWSRVIYVISVELSWYKDIADYKDGKYCTSKLATKSQKDC